MKPNGPCSICDGLPEDTITQDHRDIAASIQNVLEFGVINLASSVANDAKSSNLYLAGGVALNCVANTKIIKSGAFKNTWIQPAAGDAGGALGAALAAYYTYANKPRDVNFNASTMQGTLLGPS